MAKNNDLILSCMAAHIIVNNYDNGFGMRENKPFYKIYIYIYTSNSYQTCVNTITTNIY